MSKYCLFACMRARQKNIPLNNKKNVQVSEGTNRSIFLPVREGGVGAKQHAAPAPGSNRIIC
jgi:hypothetical protein